MLEKEIQGHDEEIKLYELGFNLVSSIAEGELDTEFNNLKNIITKQGGIISSLSKPVLINLAYTMSKVIDSRRCKYSQAYFGWVKFEIFPSKLKELKSELELFPDMLRFMLITATTDGDIDSSKVVSMISGEKEEKEEKEESGEKKEEAEEEVENTDKNIKNTEGVDEAIDSLIEESK